MIIPETIKPYPWQMQCAMTTNVRGDSAVIAPPGAGKTIAGLLTAIEVGANAVLVIAPPGKVAKQWLDQAEHWGADAHAVGGTGEGGTKLALRMLDIMKNADPNNTTVIVLPWSRVQRKQDSTQFMSMLRQRKKALGIAPFDLLLVDEAHYAQGAEETGRGRTLLGWRDLRPHLGLRHMAKHVLALTGTPITAKPCRIRSVLILGGLNKPAYKHLEPCIANKEEYEAKWWGGHTGMNWKTGREEWLTERRAVAGHEDLVRAVVISVDAEDLRKQLPSHKRELVTSGNTRAGGISKEKAQALHKWRELKDLEGGQLPTTEEIADFRTEDTLGRKKLFIELLTSWDGEAEEGRMFIIWTFYKRSAEELAAELKKVTRGCVEYLHGGRSRSTRNAVEAAAVRGDIRILVATFASTGVGVDGLQNTCCDQIVAEAPHNSTDIEQLEGRILRTGQKYPVRTRWVCEGIEEIMCERIGVKAEDNYEVTKHSLDAAAGVTPVYCPSEIREKGLPQLRSDRFNVRPLKGENTLWLQHHGDPLLSLKGMLLRAHNRWWRCEVQNGRGRVRVSEVPATEKAVCAERWLRYMAHQFCLTSIGNDERAPKAAEVREVREALKAAKFPTYIKPIADTYVLADVIDGRLFRFAKSLLACYAKRNKVSP